MDIPGQAYSDARVLADLVAKAQELEESLNRTRASAEVLRARILAEGISSGGAAGDPFISQRLYADPLPFAAGPDGAHEEAEAFASPHPEVTLATLPTHHALRIKWHLERDFPSPSKKDKEMSADPPRAVAAHEGRLRLFGLLQDGSPWECYILYSNLMDADGITIGREATDANIVISDPSVSRCHLRLALTDDGVVVSDENSTNGTRVNDVKLDFLTRNVPLKDGDIISVAEIELKAELL